MISKRLSTVASENFEKFMDKWRFWNKIRVWTGYNFIRYSVYFPLRHVLSWVPFLWKDHDYDYFFMFKMIKKKLGRMAKAMYSHDNVEEFSKDLMDPATEPANRTQIVHQLEYYYAIQRCVELCERLAPSADYVNKYDEEYNALFIKHYGGLIHLNYSSTKVSNSKYYQMNFEHDLKDIPEAKRAAAEKLYARFPEHKYEDYHRKKDINELFSTMAKYCEGWWS